MRKKLLSAVAISLLGTIPASAQVLPSPSGSMLTAPAKYATYMATYTAIAPAASTTDFLVLTGSATKTVYLRLIECAGTSSAAAENTLALVKRSTADTGGTTITPSANAGGQIVPDDANDPSATATLTAYSANPTTGALIGLVKSGKLGTNVTTAVPASTLTWTFSTDNQKALTLRGTTQVLALSGLGTSFASGSNLTCNISWIEQ